MKKEHILIKTIKENTTKEEAITKAGEMLVEAGAVNQAYIEKMHEREQLVTTYIGNHVAIPHGTDEAKKEINFSGISITQYPNGVDFGNGNTAYLVIGIAGKNDDHLDILSKIAINCQDEKEVVKMSKINNHQELINQLLGE